MKLILLTGIQGFRCFFTDTKGLFIHEILYHIFHLQAGRRVSFCWKGNGCFKSRDSFVLGFPDHICVDGNKTSKPAGMRNGRMLTLHDIAT